MVKETQPEFIYRVLATATGIKILKFRIGSITAKNIIYINGDQSTTRVSKDILNQVKISEPSHEKLYNAAIYHTIDNIEEDKDLRISISRLTVASYRNYINDYIKEYKTIETNLEKVAIDLLMDKCDVEIKCLDRDKL